MERDKMTKEELLEMVENQEAIILDLQLRLENNSNGRKSQVLELLRSSGSISILEIAKKLDISTKNVSSQLTYLRTDGYQIFTDPKGRKVLVETKVAKVAEVAEVAKVAKVAEVVEVVEVVKVCY